jgi:hypothetical protein
MTPQPRTKADDLCQGLWTILLKDEVLSEFTLARLHKDVESLQPVDWPGYLSAKGILAAIENNESELLRLADSAFITDAGSSFFLNWSNLFSQSGYISKAFAFACKAWEKDPGNSACLEIVVSLAAAVDDWAAFEAALEAWHKLHPDKVHPLLYAWLLGTRPDEEDERALAGYLEHALENTPKEALAPAQTARRTRLISSLLDGVEPRASSLL